MGNPSIPDPVRVFSRARCLERYPSVRRFTETLCAPLAPEDCVIQSMEDASPTRWHLAHTTWFFETFVLARALEGYEPLAPEYAFLFNSYYNSIGKQFPRPRRGALSRPTVGEILAYREHVDAAMAELATQIPPEREPDVLAWIELGLQHEQQHQELILTDIKHAFFSNPLYPAYREQPEGTTTAIPPLGWVDFDEGVREIGATVGGGFAYDNEFPRHRVFLESFRLADRLCTNGEFLSFLESGGYERSEHWLSAAWEIVCQERWKHPLYWVQRDGVWWEFTLAGLRRLDLSEPVVHLSYFEADAFARSVGARLPTEAEWEVAAAPCDIFGNFSERRAFHPVALAVSESSSPTQLFGDAWEWTASPYVAYPGYKPAAGALGEYNGKFMCNQMVLRGGSCATPRTHLRSTYRNFLPPQARWQFSGIRLAR